MSQREDFWMGSGLSDELMMVEKAQSLYEVLMACTRRTMRLESVALGRWKAKSSICSEVGCKPPF